MKTEFLSETLVKKSLARRERRRGATYTVSNLLPTVKYTLKIKGFKPGICINPTVNIVCGTCANNSTTIMTTPQTLSNNTISFTNPVGNTAIKIVVQYPATVVAACNILYVDDVELIKDETLDHFTPGGSWSATYGWTGSNSLTSAAINANALRVTNNSAQEGFKRNITLAAKAYTFSFYMDKGQQDLNDKEYYRVELFNSTNMNSPVYTYTTKVASTGYYNFNYTAPTAGTYVWRFRRISLNGRSSSGIAYFDDFKASYTIKQSQQVCSSPKNYRFGFNTQEKDDEVYGAGNLNTAQFWEYDTRLGRRWNVDPKPNASISLYTCFGNNPIWSSDIKGDTIARFNANGDFSAFIDDNNKNWTGQYPAYDENGQFVGYNTFYFNDVEVDVLALKNGVNSKGKVGITKIKIMTDEEVEDHIERSGVRSTEAQGSPILYAWNQGDKKMDYGVQGILIYRDLTPKAFYIRGNMGYNVGDIGNYLWGRGMKELGINIGVARDGAHVNNALFGRKQVTPLYDFGPGTNNKKPGIMDSKGDQRAITAGHNSKKPEKGKGANKKESKSKEKGDDTILLNPRF